MLKVVMNGAIDSLSTVSELSEAMSILFPAIENPNVSGHIEDMETGEVLVTIENGDATYIAPPIMIKMMDDIFEADPLLGIKLMAEILTMDRD